MLDLTEVILNDGKVIHREVTLELTSLKYRFGDFQIQKATPVELTIENIARAEAFCEREGTSYCMHSVCALSGADGFRTGHSIRKRAGCK